MNSVAAEQMMLSVDGTRSVSTLWQRPSDARACYVLAHGAGAGMTHPFLDAVATDLTGLGIAVLRYQFPFMEQGSRRPDGPKLAHATVRAAVALAGEIAPDLPFIAGGRSFGGRVTSQAQAEAPMPGVRGLAFLGFPLHPAGRPSAERGEHLFAVTVPMLFLQGTRDALADPGLLQALVGGLGERASLMAFQDADHGFHVPARSGRTDIEVRDEIVKALADWIASTA